MVKVTSQFWEKRRNISRAAPIESWERGYFSNTCDSLVGDHLYNDPFASVYNAVSSMKLLQKWQAIHMPLNIKYVHMVGALISLSNVGASLADALLNTMA